MNYTISSSYNTAAIVANVKPLPYFFTHVADIHGSQIGRNTNLNYCKIRWRTFLGGGTKPETEK